jgi:hypothetical protein
MANGSMSAGDFLVNNWGGSTISWVYPNWDIITTTDGTTGINTTPSITIPVYPSSPIQTEIDWEAIRRRLEIPGELINTNTTPLTRTEAELQQLEMRRLELEMQMRRAGIGVPTPGIGVPVPKKVVPRKPLRMIRLREDAKVS